VGPFPILALCLIVFAWEAFLSTVLNILGPQPNTTVRE
jgi:hypothetical protein